MRTLWDTTSYLMRNPANAAWIRASVAELDEWKARREEPLRKLQELVASGDIDAALRLLDRLLTPVPDPPYVRPQTRARAVLTRS